MKLRVQPPEEETSAGKSEDVEEDATQDPNQEESEPQELAEPSSELHEVSQTESEEPVVASHLQVQPPPTSTQPVPMRETFSPPGERTLQVVRSFVSSANESFITGPATIEGSSDTSGRTPDSYDTTRFGRHDHPTGSGWGPA